MKISEILANKTQFPDDAKFTIAGTEVTFAEFRRQNEESQGELARTMQERQNQLAGQQRQIEQATSTLATILENVSTATGLSFEQLTTGQIPQHLRQTVADVTRNTPTAAGVALKDDPLFKPVLEYFQPVMNDIGVMKQALSAAIGAYKNDRTKLAWLEFKADGQPEGFKSTYEEALQLAVSKGYKDDVGFPDVRKAAQELAAPLITEKTRSKTFDEGVAEGKRQQQAQMMEQLGTPGASGSTAAGIHFVNSPDNKPGQVKSIREKLNEAMNDPAITGPVWGMVQ